MGERQHSGSGKCFAANFYHKSLEGHFHTISTSHCPVQQGPDAVYQRGDWIEEKEKKGSLTAELKTRRPFPYRHWGILVVGRVILVCPLQFCLPVSTLPVDGSIV